MVFALGSVLHQSVDGDEGRAVLSWRRKSVREIGLVLREIRVSLYGIGTARSHVGKRSPAGVSSYRAA